MDDNVHVATWASAVDNNGAIWMSHFGMNGAFRYDINKHEVESIGYFDNAPLDQTWLHQNAKFVGGYVFFIPLQDKYLRRIDVVSRKIETISAPCDSLDEIKSFVVGDSHILYKSIDDNLYVSSVRDDVFEKNMWLTDVCLDFKLELDPDPFPQSVHSERNYSMDYQDGKLMLWYRDKLRIIDIDSQVVRDVDLKDKSTFQIFLKNNEIWTTHYYDCDIHNINLLDNEVVVYSGKNVEWKKLDSSSKVRPYSKLLITDKSVYIPNYRAKTIYRIDKEKSDIEEAFGDINCNIQRTQWSKGGLDPDYYCAHLFENRIYFVPNGSNKLIIYDINTTKTSWEEFSVKRKSIPYIMEYFRNSITKTAVDERDEMYDMELLINYVCSE